MLGCYWKGAQIIDSCKSMRDGVVFTSNRIIAVNVQGITESVGPAIRRSRFLGRPPLFIECLSDSP
jgi:hypothetical protein